MTEGSEVEAGRELVSLSYEGEEFKVPRELLEDEDLFREVLSPSTWKEALTEEERHKLGHLLPPGTEREEEVQRILGGENVRFGNPVHWTWSKISKGEFCPDLREACQELRELKYQQYQHNQKCYYIKLLQDVLVSRQELLQKALFAGSLENLPLRSLNGKKKRQSSLERKANAKYQRLMTECREEWGEGDDVISSDEEAAANDNADEGIPVCPPISEEDYQKMLRQHQKRRTMKKTDIDLVTRGLNMAKVTQRRQEKLLSVKSETVGPKKSIKDRLSPDFSQKFSPRGSEGGMRGGGGGGGGGGREVRGGKPRSSTESKAIYEAYGPIETGLKKEPFVEPVILQGPLPKSKFLSFFSLLKHSFEPLHDRKGELGKITKSARIILNSPEAASCSWLQTRSDWLDQILPALCYLAAEVGAVSSFDPLPHFLPLVEFRDRIDHWKWIGHDRDTEIELLVLCNHWLETLDKALDVVDYSDYEPPPPINMWTNFVFRQSLSDEVTRFREQETQRYSMPHKSYTYNIHGFEAPVGPVKGARNYKKESGSRARGHALLVPDRPNCVTILSLVRDAASRLPNGEGTRVDLCVLVRDSQYLQNHISEIQLNNAVSGALDRLHYEKDPCVRYDSPRKVWIYLHRGRSEEDFERIQWACDMAAKQRKALMTRPKIKPKIICRERGGEEVVLQEGGPQATPTGSSGAITSGGGKGGGESGRTGRKTTARTSHTGQTGSGTGAKGASVGGDNVKSLLNPLAIVAPSGTPVVVASVVSRASTAHSPSCIETLPSPSPGQPTTAPEKATKPKKANPLQKTLAHSLAQQLLSASTPSSLPEPDWDIGDVEMPFLSSQPTGTNDLAHDSSSSWQSSDDEAAGQALPITPSFLTRAEGVMGVAVEGGSESD